MSNRALAIGFLSAALAACAPRPETPAMQPEVVPPGPVVSDTTPPLREMPRAMTLAGYKMEVAHRIASSSPEVFANPLPEVLKSVVVLDISIDRDGLPRHISVRRSNGYRQLEQRAEASVRRAAPFTAPAPSLLRGASSVRFLETILFRDDGRFQIRSLVETPR